MPSAERDSGRTYELRWFDDEGHLDSIQFAMSDEDARNFIAACVTPPGLPLHRTEAGYPNCSTCDGGGCPDCTDPA